MGLKRAVIPLFAKLLWPNDLGSEQYHQDLVVLGDHAYIDGGEIAVLVNGKNESTYDHPSWQLNDTLSIDLRKSWSSLDVEIKAIPKPAGIPVLDGQAMWRDRSSKAFYIWAGATPFNEEVQDSNIWRFAPDGGDKGDWTEATISNHDNFKYLLQPKRGAFAQSDSVGYYFGGFATIRTDKSISDWKISRPFPGLVSYDMSGRQKVVNSSSEGFGKWGTFKGGSMEFVPFGPDGLLLVLGGAQAPLSENLEGRWKPMDFGKIFIYNPASMDMAPFLMLWSNMLSARKWHTQQTTGTQPTPREKFCTAGVAGQDNTYDIFIYGGSVWGEGISEEVYVLTLPGFNFFKANTSIGSTPRECHACAVVGKRQMLSVGGTSNPEAPESLTEPDPWSLV
ncbi:hypothetical protein CGCS363_v005074 [Colletotrichum siamense]|uniref:uncharacterized protein n=1 Tax=Colletotrichum siamense TaxID=690259 RepID=UPI0018724BD2|nr:uncharacterized protein CGCS363_v005074 [Colletotrichum siamense]KAF5506207.1 hypothetical protein CGCS363_v005074 [Colletotrichum siamense]